MKRIAETPVAPAQGRAPRTRLGGPVTLQGKQYATVAALEAALTAAVEDAGAGVYTVRLTRKGWALAAQLQREAGR